MANSKIVSIGDYLPERMKPVVKVGIAELAPAREATDWDLAEDRTSEPIKSIDDIEKVSAFLLSNRRWRDNMLFICGINFGLRISDLTRLRFCNIINDDGTFKESFPILEKKTKNTRKKKVNRMITINEAVTHAVMLYLENTPNVAMDDYLFKCEGNRGGHKNVPITTFSVNRILKGIGEDCGLHIKFSTHSLRKTFAYHQMAMSNHDPRKLLLLQKMFGHSTMEQTLMYIGITKEEMAEAYKDLNLGITQNRYYQSRVIDSILREA